ncbi:hypothetical protein [Leptospira alstonii]|uniref:hypothetical protein n=1 Tax=Leptospira alstonii TaxID=28452 RepID=UPI0009E7C184|nr:hypothetical protein [Leptospira alstonii]
MQQRNDIFRLFILKSKILLIILNVIVFWILNCSIGTAREACKNNLKKRGLFEPSDDSCEFISVVFPLTAAGSTIPEEFDARKNALLTTSLLNCYQYYEKLQECNKEEKKYLPAIYSKE